MSHDEQQHVKPMSDRPDPALSVIVYARDDAGTITECLASLSDQDFPHQFEVLVVDDCSSDGTAEIVRTEFPQFVLVRQERVRGWVASVRRALTMARGEVLAFLGSHCTADRGWLSAVDTRMSGKRQVMTGRGTHGEDGFLARFEAVSVHASYVGSREGEVSFLWDDNFAIRSAVLERALPRSDRCLSDGAGAVLLSLELQRMGIPIHYEPSAQIDHVTHPLGAIIAYWYGEMAENAVAIKLEEPSLPWARILWTGPVAALTLAGARFYQGIRASWLSRDELPVSLLEVGAHGCLYACLGLAYFVGLCREIGQNWGQINHGLRARLGFD